jgi:ABC-type branched-subunit amino acid transport system ATPase component
MVQERRSKPRPAPNPGLAHMTAIELDAAIKELNEKVRVLMAERQARQATPIAKEQCDAKQDKSG